MKSWISIQDYAAKYRVSISTLRRRIKAEKVTYRLDEGKYFLEDNGAGVSRAGMITVPFPHRFSPPLTNYAVDAQETSVYVPNPEEQYQKALGDLKAVYERLVEEKDSQIILLKQQIADLQTLARVLESEVDRLKPTPSVAVAPQIPVPDEDLLPADPFSSFYTPSSPAKT